MNIPQWFGHALSQDNYVILSIIPGCIDFLSGWYPAQEFIFKLIIEDSKLNITQPKPTWISHSLYPPTATKIKIKIKIPLPLRCVHWSWFWSQHYIKLHLSLSVEFYLPWMFLAAVLCWGVITPYMAIDYTRFPVVLPINFCLSDYV